MIHDLSQKVHISSYNNQYKLKKRIHNRLYRYQRFDSKQHPIDRERLEDLLVGNRIYFYSPNRLNDPYDCKIQFRIKDATKQMWLDFFKKAHRRKSSDISEEDLDRMAEIEYRKTPHKTPEGRAKWRQFTQDLLQPELDRMGLLCMSKKDDSILMWSYYADGHKGFCLIFDETVAKTNFYLTGVDYNDEFLSFREFVDAMDMHDYNRSVTLRLILLRKSATLWAHEDERRIIIPAESIDIKGRSFECPSGL
jgi:hypothetical protein